MPCSLQLLLMMAGSLFAQALYNPGNILLMDHLNINHQKMTGLKTGHELVKLFYVDTLGLSLDPRKIENIEKGRKTLWTNAGINQFHLPEAETAQVFDGVITLAFKDKSSLSSVLEKLQNPSLASQLDNTKFRWSGGSGADGLVVNDPWGSTFRLVVDPSAGDVRGRQPVGSHTYSPSLSHTASLIVSYASNVLKRNLLQTSFTITRLSFSCCRDHHLAPAL